MIVRPFVRVTAPLKRLSPRTVNVVVGFAVPIPTRFSFTLMTKTSVSKTPDVAKVEVAVVMVRRFAPPVAISNVSTPLR